MYFQDKLYSLQLNSESLETRKTLCKKLKKKETLISHYCATQENKHLHSLHDFLIKEFKIKTNYESNHMQFIPFFDGAYINCFDKHGKQSTSKIELENLVKNTTKQILKLNSVSKT